MTHHQALAYAFLLALKHTSSLWNEEEAEEWRGERAVATQAYLKLCDQAEGKGM
jgi:hypothetical protein